MGTESKAISKHKPSLLKAKVNQSTTQLNGQLMVTGAPILARSHHFAKPSPQTQQPDREIRDDLQDLREDRDHREDSVSVRSQSVELAEGEGVKGS